MNRHYIINFKFKNQKKNNNKTLQRFCDSVFNFKYKTNHIFYFMIGHEFSLYNIAIIMTAVLFTSLLEAKTTQVDNLVLPLFMFSFMCWIN